MKMSNITPFAFGDNLVRSMTDENGNPWFVAKDVCRILGIEKYRDALGTLDEDEKGRPVLVDTLGGPQEMATVSESGLYALIFRSRKSEAKVFSKWVCSEVLPTLRKTGKYEMPDGGKKLSVSSDVDKLRREEPTEATRRLARNLPRSSERFIDRACDLAIRIGITDIDKMYELYVCYCKIFHTRESLNLLGEDSSLDPDIIEYIWKEVRQSDKYVSEKTQIRSFLLLAKAVEQILKEKNPHVSKQQPKKLYKSILP